MIYKDNSNHSEQGSVVAARVPVIPLSYFGQAGEVLKLHIVNLLLTIVTLGFYSFWGKTRIRRYMTSHISIGQDRFEYTGTGKELFFGALKALLIFLPIAWGTTIEGINIIATVLLFGLLIVALFLALRYRLSRTRWRGIRFSLGGSIKDYLILAVKRMFINLVTLGWKIPQSDLMKWSYIANHMSYGDTKFSFEGDASRLQKVHLKTLMISSLAVVVACAMAFGAFPDDDAAADGAAPILSMIVFYLGMGAAFAARLWYYAAFWQEKFRGLRIGKLRFKIYITGAGLAKLHIVNFLLIMLTLGIAKPIAAHRTLRYFVTNLKIGGDVNDLIAEQSKISEKSALGDALAADVGFDMGL